jgi:glycosyltransferase involved in cell wall biosynthesis
MNWTFWLCIVSPHISEMLRALASMPNHNVTVVAELELPERRKAIGWNTPDCSPARVVIGPQDAEVEQLIGRAHGEETVHMVGTGKRSSLNWRVLPRLARTGAMVGLMSETVDSRGILGMARRVKYSLDRYSLEDKLDCIVTVGEVGVRWYELLGYDSSRIFPFIYVTERPVLIPESSNDWKETETFRILYLGHFIRRKDGVTALRALAGLSDLDWQFDLVGDGPDLERWKRAAAESGVATRIRFHNAVNNRMIGNLLEHADVLLLPSKYDGWGAVVNEALMCGVPVVCSDNCGAADLLRDPWRGSTFKAGSVESLRSILRGWIERGRRDEESSARIRHWSSAIEGEQVARYLVEIVKYVQVGGQRPSPPWY